MADVLEDYAQQMCACRDKACADDVQERLTKWGTDMARHSDPTERSDPEVAKRTTEIMSRYVDCMTKLMMSSPGGTP